MRTFLGIEIGGTKLQIVLGNEQAQILERVRFVVDRAQGAEGIRKQIKEGLKTLTTHAVAGIGIGFGGPVNHQSGRILTSYQIEGWGDFILQDWLEKHTRIPVWIDNDANVAALGEALHGAGKGAYLIFYITLGSGVGAGLIIDRRIYHGSGNTETEFGHMLLDKTGRTVESSCSGWAVDEKIRVHAQQHPGSLLHQLTRDLTRGESRVLASALKQGDGAASKIVAETADDIAFALAHAVHLLNPEIVILGGGLSLLGEPLRLLIQEKLPGYLMDVLRPGPSIQLTALKEDAVPVGALTLAINKLASA